MINYTSTLESKILYNNSKNKIARNVQKFSIITDIKTIDLSYHKKEINDKNKPSMFEVY
jgi:hypothetical protein